MWHEAAKEKHQAAHARAWRRAFLGEDQMYFQGMHTNIFNCEPLPIQNPFTHNFAHLIEPNLYTTISIVLIMFHFVNAIIYHCTCWRVSQQSPFSFTDIKSQSAHKGCAPGTKTFHLWHVRWSWAVCIQTCEKQARTNRVPHLYSCKISCFLSQSIIFITCQCGISAAAYETIPYLWIVTCHVQGNFVESDEQFRSRPRGGRKRKYPVIETLLRKRIVPPSESDPLSNNEHDDSSWQSA